MTLSQTLSATGSSRPRAKGRLKVLPGEIKIILDADFCRYYRWLFERAHYSTLKTNMPKFGAHIGIVNPNIHKDINTSLYSSWDDIEVWFEYDIEGNYGGFTKGFMNFWLDVFCVEAENIAKTLGVLKKSKGFADFHITICNTKNL